MHLQFVRGERVEIKNFFDGKLAVLRRFPKFYVSDLWQRNAQGFFKKLFHSKENPTCVAIIQYNGELLPPGAANG